MADFTAKDVQALRQATGAGMMDAKKALQDADGDFEQARKVLRERGLAKADDRAGRENAQGAIAISTDTDAVGLVELKCETDFVAKSPDFVALTQALADSVAARGEAALGDHKDTVDDLKVALKENIEVGRAVQVTVGEGEAVEDERQTLLNITKAEGKPEAAWPKIVEGRLNGWYKERVLLEQPFVRDEKQTIAQVASGGGGGGVRYAQLFIGGGGAGAPPRDRPPPEDKRGPLELS